MRAVRHQLSCISGSEATVLVTGPSGSGKENVARAVHLNSARKDGPFIAINCGAIPADLAEAELFGAKSGAYTGATQTRIGKIEAANGGTLFLDEIGDLPLALQVKLLRVLETREVVPLGSNQSVPVDVRIVAATNADLDRQVTSGAFRNDLYWRLAVICIDLLPLYQRGEDIPLLIEHFTSFHRTKLKITEGGHEALAAHPWPGNIRELRNLVERAIALGELVLDEGTVIRLLAPRKRSYDEWLSRPASVPPHREFRQTRLWPPEASLESLYDGQALSALLRETEVVLISQALEATGGTIAASARMLGVKRTTLVEKMKRLGIKALTDGNVVIA